MKLFNQPHPVLLMLISWNDNYYPEKQKEVNEEALQELNKAYKYIQSSVIVFYANTND